MTRRPNADDHGDEQLAGEEATAADRAHEEVAQVAPLRLARDRLAAEDGDDDHEHELAREPQRGRGDEQARTATRAGAGNPPSPGSGGLALSAIVMMIGISADEPDRGVGARAAELLVELGGDERTRRSPVGLHQPEERVLEPATRGDGLDADTRVHEGGDTSSSG